MTVRKSQGLVLAEDTCSQDGCVVAYMPHTMAAPAQSVLSSAGVSTPATVATATTIVIGRSSTTVVSTTGVIFSNKGNSFSTAVMDDENQRSKISQKKIPIKNMPQGELNSTGLNNLLLSRCRVEDCFITVNPISKSSREAIL